MERTNLGAFELLVILAVMHRAPDAYGVSIAEEIAGRTGKETSRGALYVTLQRLLNKGLLSSEMCGEDTGARSGHRRRFYEVTPLGLAATASTREAMQSMWQGLEQQLDRT